MSCNESVVYDESSEPALKSANVPTPNIIGALDLVVSPTSETNIWNGTIDFGDEYGVYNIAYFTYTPPKENAQAYLFDEDFIIYQLGTNWKNPENVVLRGSHKGLLVFANKDPEPIKVTKANGKITEANAPFEMCLGRPYHGSGTAFFEDGAPPYFEGLLWINYVGYKSIPKNL